MTSILLFVVLGVRSKDLKQPAYFLMLVLIGLFGFLATLNGILSYLAIERDTEFLRISRQLGRLDASRPTIVLLGSSYTARNLDGKRLESIVNLSQGPVQVLQLSRPGGYAFEQDFYLEKLLENLYPFLLLVEIGTEQSITVGSDNHLKQDSIAYHDLTRFLDMFRMSTERYTFTIEFVKSAVPHFLARIVNLGLAHAAHRMEEIPVRPGYQPEPKLPSALPLEQILTGLRTESALSAPETRIVTYLGNKIRRWNAKGVKQVIFWQPPHADPVKRSYTTSLCRSLGEQCLPFNDLTVLDGDYWNDHGHLTKYGAVRFTNWFGQQLVRRLDN